MCHLSFLIIFITFCSRCIYSLSSLIILFRNLLHLFISIQIQIPSWPSFISFLLFWRSLTRWQKIFLTFQCSFVSFFPHVLCFVFQSICYLIFTCVLCVYICSPLPKQIKTKHKKQLLIRLYSYPGILGILSGIRTRCFFFLQRCPLGLDH